MIKYNSLFFVHLSCIQCFNKTDMWAQTGLLICETCGGSGGSGTCKVLFI